MKKIRYAFFGAIILLALTSCRTAQPVIPEKTRRELSTLLPELQRRNPEWLRRRMELLPSSPGKVRLLLGGSGLRDLSPLKSYDYEELILDRTGNTDLQFARELDPQSLMVFSDREISLQGIGEWKNLRELSVKYLAVKRNLPELSLKPLVGLRLHSLRVENARLTGLFIPPGVEKLFFENCIGLSSLSFLKGQHALSLLEFVNCPDLRLEELPELPVTELSLAFSPLFRPEALHRLRKLKTLTVTAPDGIGFLRDMKNLETLSVSGNARELDISVLATLPLRHLELSAVKIPDLKPLGKCSRLEVLNLTMNGIGDLTPLRGLPLQALFVAGNNIESLEPLAGCKDLDMLYLTQCPVVSLIPLIELPLKTLKIERCLVYDLAPLAGMSLRTFWLINCPVSDISALRGTGIRDLMLNDCPISSLDPLTGMSGLEKVYLQKLPALRNPLPEGIRGKVFTKEDQPNAGI